MRYEVTTAVASEVLSLATAKAHLRVETAFTDDDTLITALISVARDEAELITQRAIGAQTITLCASSFAGLELRHPPITAVTSITYADENGDSQTLSTSVYYVDYASEVARVRLKDGQVWPQLHAQGDTVQVVYTAGYTAGNVPPLIKQWMLLRIGSLYETREADSDRPPVPTEFVVRLLDRYRVLAP